jgi:hypothetical protein
MSYQEFTGTLMFLNQPSDASPTGNSGRKMLVNKKTASMVCITLLGVPVWFDGHGKEKCGIITKVEIVGKELKVFGVLSEPKAIQALEESPEEYGMSCEMMVCYYRKINDEIREMYDFRFSGAAILPKKEAAYRNTYISLIASQEQ